METQKELRGRLTERERVLLDALETVCRARGTTVTLEQADDETIQVVLTPENGSVDRRPLSFLTGSAQAFGL